MDEQALNKKLAEWAEFVFDEGAEYGIPPVFGLWYSPDNNQVGYPELPPFTQSLSACFKWLMPHILFYKFDNFSDKRYCNAYIVIDDLGWAKVEAKTLALALCLAIEKLIDQKT